MNFTYGFIFDSVRLPADFIETSAEQLIRGVGISLQTSPNKINQRILELPPGNWEVLSHSITALGQNLLISYLIRRPAQ